MKNLHLVKISLLVYIGGEEAPFCSDDSIQHPVLITPQQFAPTGSVSGRFSTCSF